MGGVKIVMELLWARGKLLSNHGLPWLPWHHAEHFDRIRAIQLEINGEVKFLCSKNPRSHNFDGLGSGKNTTCSFIGVTSTEGERVP